MDNKIYDCIIFEGDLQQLKSRLESSYDYVEKQIILLSDIQFSGRLDIIKNEKTILINHNKENLLDVLIVTLKSFKTNPFSIVAFSRENEFPDFKQIDLEYIKRGNTHLICSHETFVWDKSYRSQIRFKGTKFVSMNYLLTSENKIYNFVKNRKYIIDDGLIVENGYVILGNTKTDKIYNKFFKKDLVYFDPYVEDLLKVHPVSETNVVRKKPKTILVNFLPERPIDYRFYDEILKINKNEILIPESALYSEDNFNECFFINEIKQKIKNLLLFDIDVIHFDYQNKLTIKTWGEIKNLPMEDVLINKKTLY